MDGTVVLLALLALGLIIAIPISIAFLFWRQSKFAGQLSAIQQAQREQNDGLRRELAHLRSQLAGLSLETQTSPAGHKVAQQTVPSVASAY